MKIESRKDLMAAILICVIIVSFFGFNLYLKRQTDSFISILDQENNLYITALERVMERIEALEVRMQSGKTELSLLREENLQLKEGCQKGRKVKRMEQRETRKETPAEKGMKRTSSGNRGFLMKDGRLTQ